MWSLPLSDSAESLSNRLAATWQHQVDLFKAGRKSKPSLKIAMFRAYSGPYVVGGIFNAAYDCLSFLQPQLLRLLLSYVSSYETDKPMPPVAGYAISILMFVSALVATSTLHQSLDRRFSTSK
jgi:ATP-binding cassette subfamily C (CFTR/MRP) protein 1